MLIFIYMLLHIIVDGDNKILTKLVDQQQQILDLLKEVVTNTTLQSNPEPTTTGEMMMRTHMVISGVLIRTFPPWKSCVTPQQMRN